MGQITEDRVNKNVLKKDIKSLKEIFDKVTVDGVDEGLVVDTLIAIAAVSDENESISTRLKAINEAAPKMIKDARNNPDKELSNEEKAKLDRVYRKWEFDASETIEKLLNEESSLPLSDIQIFTKEQFSNWAKSIKKELKGNQLAFLMKSMIKK